MSQIHGHPDSWLENVTIENLKLFLNNDPENPMEKATEALHLRWAKNLRMRDVEVHWEEPASTKWRSAVYGEDIRDSEWEGLSVGPPKAGADEVAVRLVNVEGVTLRNPRALSGTGIFLQVDGAKSGDIRVVGGDLRKAGKAFRLGTGTPEKAVTVEPPR